MNLSLRWVHNQTKRIPFWKVLRCFTHLQPHLKRCLLRLSTSLLWAEKESTATIIHQHAWQYPMLLNTTMNGMNRKLEDIVYNCWPSFTSLAAVYFMLLQFVVNCIWNVLSQQQFSPNLLTFKFLHNFIFFENLFNGLSLVSFHFGSCLRKVFNFLNTAFWSCE